METYPWTKFYYDHCDDDFVERMISEDVHINWDEMPDATDIVDAIISMENQDNREWIYKEYIDSGKSVDEAFLLEYITCEGIDDFSRKLIADYDHDLSHDLVMELLDYGMEDEDLSIVLERYRGQFSASEAEELFASYNIPESYARDILQNRISEKLSVDQIEEILNCIDESLYPLMMSHMSNLTFEERMDLSDNYGIGFPGKNRRRDTAGSVFTGLAMATAVIEGIRRGIDDAQD